MSAKNSRTSSCAAPGTATSGARLALRAAGTENWRVTVWFLILLPMAVAAWLKIGPIAGVIAVAWLLFVAFVRSQPPGRG